VSEEAIAVSTVVYLPPEEVFEFLLDFPGYARYSEYLKQVRQFGDGSAGTRYELRFAWWKLSYTTRSEVTEVVEPERIDFRILKDVDAAGYWAVEPIDLPADAPPEAEAASRVHFRVDYDPGSVSAGSIDLPRLVSLDWVIDRVKPLVVDEAERIVERVVADLEGTQREVHLDVDRH
jgi:uncharacterized protein YndB with AHSA1/START domain